MGKSKGAKGMSEGARSLSDKEFWARYSNRLRDRAPAGSLTSLGGDYIGKGGLPSLSALKDYFTPRTSETHPLVVDWMRPTVVRTPGRLGMCLAPGKQNPKGVTGSHERSMERDLDRLEITYGANVLVTLMEDWELDANKMATLFTDLRGRGIESLWLSIRDESIPTSMRGLATTVNSILDALDAGKNVVVHCRGGHGRTGLVVACVLVALGYTTKQAMEHTRAARSGTIHNRGQEDFIALYESWLEEDGEGE